MAKNNKATATVAIMALATLVAFGETGTSAPLASVQPLVDAGHAELGPVDPATGLVAVRATAQGIASMNSTATTATAGTEAAAATTGAKFAIRTNVPLPAAAKRGRTGTTYPFDSLEVGHSFFVANTADKPDAAKSMASTVSSATARYAVPVTDEAGNAVTETVTVKQYKVDESGKRVKGEDGKSIVESTTTETRPKMKNTRVFVVVAEEGGAGVFRKA